MGITNSDKELSAARIGRGSSFQVRLSLTAVPDIVSNPADIVLMLDRSGSMTGSALASLKLGAKAFIDIISKATGGAQSGQIGSGSRIGIVSFSTAAAADTQLTTSVNDLKAAVDALSTGGNTNHADAFTKAFKLLTPPSGNAQVMVMFTDGQTTTGADPRPIAAAARDAGTVIYTIGLSGRGGVDSAELEDWASKPALAYAAITPDAAELEQIFAGLARNISNPGAANRRFSDAVFPCYQITDVSTPAEGAVLEFTVQNINPCSGTVEANESITSGDAEDDAVIFPSPGTGR